MSRLSIEIPDDVHRQIKAQASLRGLSMREYVLRQITSAASNDSGKSREHFSQSGLAGIWSDRDVSDSVWDWLDRPSLGTRTKAEIDEYIADERARWNDDE